VLTLTWLVGITICLALSIRLAFSFVEVSGTSMAPKLLPSDVVVAFKFWPAAWLRPGMTIVFQYPIDGPGLGNTISGEGAHTEEETDSRLMHSLTYRSDWRIKMVGAVAGEPFPVRVREVLGNCERSLEGMDTEKWGLVPSGHVFALGLSAKSIDSRNWGPVRLQRFTRLVLFKLPNRRDKASA